MVKRELLREQLLAIFNAGIAAVAPDAAIISHVRLTGANADILEIDGHKWDLSHGRLVVAGAGKGAAPMGQAVEKILGPRIDSGFIVVKDGHDLPLKHMAIGQASHPVPNSAGLAASRRILEIARELGPSDTLICLLTGGASALTPCPPSELSLEDLGDVTRVLLASGMPIDAVNSIRRHLSEFGGGRLAKAANGATVISLIVSDVIGDDLCAIASGPTAPDSTTYADCLRLIDEYHIADRLPQNALELLRMGAAGKTSETLKPGDETFDKVHNFLVASNAQALEACAAQAMSLGMTPVIEEQPMQGEASEVADNLVRRAMELSLTSAHMPLCYMAGGETTVTINGRGMGGRNQEMALAAAIALAGHNNICALFGGTDGTDGPTDAAGGFAFGDTVLKMGGLPLAQAYLNDNDSYSALLKSGDLLITGPTLTNVMDLAIFIIDRC